MASPPRIERIDSLRLFTEFLESEMKPDVPVWYRGCTRSDYELVPSLYRHPTESDVDKLIAMEGKILQRFRERSIPYRPPVEAPSDPWSLLFVMQHFGVPTRLLDWTENPFMGLYFALFSPGTSSVASDDAAVWLLRPTLWNSGALLDISFEGDILSLGAEPLGSYEPKDDARYMRVPPVAMYGLHNSPRIVAQRGVFTIFGKSAAPMDRVFADGEYDESSLLKLEIPGDTLGSMRQSLLGIGVTDSVVFPDLSGLALELKRFFGFVQNV